MASLALTDTSSSATARLFPFRSRNGVLLLRHLVGPLPRPPLTPLRSLTAVHSSIALSPVVSAAGDGSAKVIDGKMVAKQITEEVASEVSRMKAAIGVVLGLAVVFVGDRKDSATYVRKKKKIVNLLGSILLTCICLQIHQKMK